MKYILHIGPMKTGTDSIQHAFRKNRDILGRYGIVYPGRRWGGMAHHNIAYLFCGQSPQEVGLPNNWVENFRAEIADAETCIVSSESFTNVQDVKEVASIFPPNDTTVVIYLREPVTHTASWYRQQIFASNISMSFMEFAQHYRLPFSDLADRWCGVYGRENVILRQYDRKLLFRGDVVADFANLIHPELVDALQQNEYELNPGIAGNLLFIKRVLNCFISIQEAVSIIGEIKKLRLMKPRFSGKIPVDQETASRISFLSRNKLAALERNFGISMKPHDGPIDAPLCPNRDKLPTDLRQILGEAKSNDWKIAKLIEQNFRLLDIEGANINLGE